MKKLVAFAVIMVLALVPVSAVFAGGDEDTSDVEKALEDQIYKTRDLEDKVADLERQLDDLKNRPPQIVKEERVVEKEGERAFELPIHGFFNVNYADANYPGSEGGYDQENFNIIFDYIIDENFHFLGEIGTRHGEEVDVDLNAVQGVGEVNVVQAWLDWKFSDAAILKFGKFLTPYGNWNVPLHSPAVYLSIWEPILVRRDLFPRAVTGIQFYGKKAMGNVDLLYNLYTGNGVGWRPHSEDDNTNKGVGGRLGILSSFMSAGTLEVGASGYAGRDGTLDNEDHDTLGIDALINVYPFQLRGEFARSNYNIPVMDWTRDAWYIQASYNFLEKYDAYLRYDKEDTDTSPFAIDDMEVTAVGLNYKPIPVVAFKVEYDLYDSDSTGSYEVIAGSVAVEF
ncbi:MAG: hypothetical protein JW928_01740 [Candidatus Aureabacteria bacterium]|nr:hypothetical protein [Candidatus Auribacterota bacterium]